MTQHLTHARIGYDHIGLRGTVVASSESSGFAAANAANDLTYSFWKPSGLPATYEIQLPNREPCDYFGLAAHDLRTQQVVAVMQAFLDNEWTTLPVLTKLGELWTFKAGLSADGGLSNGGTHANRRRGYGVDGAQIVDENGIPQSFEGPYSLASEGALANDVATNVATGTDASQSTAGFTVLSGDDIDSHAEHAVSGTRSLRVDPNTTVEASPISATQLLAYSATLKVKCLEAGQIDVFLNDDVGEIDNKTVNLSAGKWTYIHITGTSASGATEVALVFVADVEVWVDEIAVYQGGVRQTWIDTGAEDVSALEYYPEWLQQLAGDAVTINLWARVPTGNYGANQVLLNIEDAAGGFLRIRLLTPTRSLSFQVSDGVTTDSLSGGTDWIDGDWHMFTAVLDGAAARLYVDGVLLSTDSTAHPPSFATATKFQLGHDDGATRLTADGETLMANLSIVNWVATAAEILEWFATPPVELPAFELDPNEDDRPIMRLVEEATSTRFRLRFVGPNLPTIGVIRMGKALEMERPLYGGHTPISLARTTVIRPNISERGQWLGRSIIRSGAVGSWNWTHLTAAWVRRYLQPFITAARTRPFFIAWRPDSFPAEAGYCWTTGDLSAANMGRRDFMSFQLDAEGLGHE